MKSSLTSHCIYTNLTARGNKVGWTAPQSSKGSDLVAEFDNCEFKLHWWRGGHGEGLGVSLARHRDDQ